METWNHHFAKAILRQAIADWRAGMGRPEWSKRGKLSAGAGDWIFNPDRRALVKLEDVCAVLGVEPDAMRAKIRAK